MSDPLQHRHHVDVHVHVHGTSDPATVQKLDAILRQLGIINQKETQMAADLTALKAAVQADTEVDQSAITLMTGLTAKIQELINASGNTVDPAELQGIVDGINATKDALAAAVVANTPAAP